MDNLRNEIKLIIRETVMDAQAQQELWHNVTEKFIKELSDKITTRVEDEVRYYEEISKPPKGMEYQFKDGGYGKCNC